jgi:hypothetical protein
MTMTTMKRLLVGTRSPSLAATLLLLSHGAAGQLAPLGDEFQVNNQTVGYQSSNDAPFVGAAADGAFVVIWPNEPAYNVSARRFDSAGSPVGSEFEILPPGNYAPSLAVAPGGEFLVVWSKPDAHLDGIFAQRFDSGGVALGTELQVNAYVTNFQTRVRAAADGLGNLLIAWESSEQDGEHYGVFARGFDGSGAPIGSEFQVNVYTAGTEVGAVVAGDPAGGFVVTWISYRFDGVLPNFFSRRIEAAMNPLGAEFQVNTYTGTSNGLHAASIAPGGELVVVWSTERDGDADDIFGQRFSSAGEWIGSDFQINTHTVAGQLDPAIAHDENGGFAVTWTSAGATDEVFGRRFTSSGEPSGPEFRVNAYTPNSQTHAGIAPLPGGRFVAVWQSNEQDGDLTGVFGQLFASVGTPLAGKKLLIKNPAAGPAKNKLLLLSKDAAIATPQSVGGDPRCAPLGSGSSAAGGRLRVVGDGGDFTIDLPCASWVADTGRTKFNYRDASGATCKRVTVKDGRLLKAVCTGPQVAYSLGAAQDEVGVSLTLGDPSSPTKYCVEFGAETGADVVKDGSNGRSYKARDANQSAFCP